MPVFTLTSRECSSFPISTQAFVTMCFFFFYLNHSRKGTKESQDSFDLRFPDHARKFNILKMVLSHYYSAFRKSKNLKIPGKTMEQLETIILSEVTIGLPNVSLSADC